MDNAPRVSRLPVWVLVTSFWVLLALTYSSSFALMSPRPNERIIRTQITWQSLYYLTWAPLTLLIWRVTRGWDFERLGWLRFTARHALFAVALGVLHAAVVVMIAVRIIPDITEPTSMILTPYIRSRLHLQLLIYAAIVGAGQAMGYYNHYRERQVAAAQLEAQLTAARLDTLRAQLQPHFLFNSLHSIASLARAGDTAGVVRLISGFSDLLRHLLESNVTHHSVRDELSLLERYLDIQRVRFGDRLGVTIDSTAEALSARVPLLIVQPLVENALRHGFAPRIEPGHVAITARRAGRFLEVEVSDDGVGLPAGWSIQNGPGTGLRNLASRLAAEYGNDQQMTVVPREPDGVRVSIRLPFLTA